MGCVSSTSQEAIEAEEAAKIAQRQRRKLTLAPKHVGDITSDAEKRNPVDDDGATLTEIEEKAKGTLIHAAKSRKGVVPYNRGKVNQDRAIVKYGLQNDPTISLFGVMDGHGEFGHFVAGFVQEHLPNYLSEEKGLKTDTIACIPHAVHGMASALAATTINITFSGTTCVFGVLIDRTLYVGNIGDSRCVLCRQVDNGIQAIGLSEDQKPDTPKEKERILKAGGRVQPLPGAVGEDCGPCRVWLAEVDVPGLAMSRSIGDAVSQTVGVISTPEVVKHQIAENDIFAIWASDGVWEFLSNEEVLHIVWQHRHDLNAATEAVIEESTRRWRQEEEVIDDITCVVVMFNPPK